MTISRRQLSRDGSLIAGACAFSGGSVNASTPGAVVGADYNQKLGVTLFINAASTYRILSASTLPEQVQAAIALSLPKTRFLLSQLSLRDGVMSKKSNEAEFLSPEFGGSAVADLVPQWRRFPVNRRTRLLSRP